jgi:NitT/TauT family transport system substrate-binding protein
MKQGPGCHASRLVSRALCVACMVAASAFAAGTAQAQKTVYINTGSAFFGISDAWSSAVPLLMGFYKQEGIDAEFQASSGAGPALQQLVAGGVSMTYAGTPAAMDLISKGAPIEIVASLWNTNRFYPVVLEGSPIKTLADLKGKRFGTLAVASTNTLWAKALLKDAGLDPDKDVEYVGIGSGGSAMHALTSGEVAAWQSMETIYDTLEANSSVRLHRFDDLPVLKRLSYTSGAMVTEGTIRKDPKLVVGLLRAAAKGYAYSVAHPEDSLRMYWKVFPEQRPLNVSEDAAIKANMPVILKSLSKVAGAPNGPFGYVEPENVASIVDFFRSAGYLSDKLPAERYFTDRFLKEANDFDHAAVVALPAKL